ncbi:MAG TPA: Fic family protein [Candidatus Babeliales bacterium]|nr:Fic family protein [Candidatus Babeliales bacterium]
MKFEPVYHMTPKIVQSLMRIEAVKTKVVHLPLTAFVLRSLRETARLYTTHYSTMIEGNQLDLDQIKTVLEHKGHFPGRERDEREVKGYYAALMYVEKWAAERHNVTEAMIKTIHALVMASGQIAITPTVYRSGQNVIRDTHTRAIVYMPPAHEDVAALMKALVNWINENRLILPYPLVAGIAHYQFATIHPYDDGNGRTARLLTTAILHLGGYDLKGLYSLEEYYARNLAAYYDAISIGDSHNYYMGRAEADTTKWVEYFITGMAASFEAVLTRMEVAQDHGASDHSSLLRRLDPKQRKALELFAQFEVVTSRQIGELFGFKPRTSAALCVAWVEQGFLRIVNPSNKARTYTLGDAYKSFVK